MGSHKNTLKYWHKSISMVVLSITIEDGQFLAFSIFSDLAQMKREASKET